MQKESMSNNYIDELFTDVARCANASSAVIEVLPMSDNGNVEEFLFESNPECPDIIPILPMTGNVLFPGTITPINVTRDMSLKLLRKVAESGEYIGVVTQRNDYTDIPARSDLYDIGCLAQYVQENPTSPVAPYILERYVPTSVSYETVAALFRQLGGDAVKSYHYRRLQQRLHQLEALAEGSPIPSFSYTGSDNRTVKIDSVLTGGSYNLIIVGATYCSQCQKIEKEVRESFENVHPVVIDVDRQKDGWDAPLLKLLDIDHVPYLILRDKDRRIVARDLRIWQLKRTLEQQPTTANKNKQ